MKLFIRALSCFVFLAGQAHAFWIARPVEQRVVESDCIVVATLESVEMTSFGEDFAEQKAKFRLVRAIKGKVAETFLVHGMKTTMCIPFVDFSQVAPNGTCLMFLGAPDDKGIRHPLEASFFQIVDGKLMWGDPGETSYQLRTIQHVERSIRSIAKNPPSQRAKLRS
jgi:hypothetical protein